MVTAISANTQHGGGELSLPKQNTRRQTQQPVAVKNCPANNAYALSHFRSFMPREVGCRLLGAVVLLVSAFTSEWDVEFLFLAARTTLPPEWARGLRDEDSSGFFSTQQTTLSFFKLLRTGGWRLKFVQFVRPLIERLRFRMWTFHSSTYVLDSPYWVLILVKPTNYCYKSKVLVSVQQIVSVGRHDKAAVAAMWILRGNANHQFYIVFVSQTRLHFTKSQKQILQRQLVPRLERQKTVKYSAMTRNNSLCNLHLSATTILSQDFGERLHLKRELCFWLQKESHYFRKSSTSMGIIL